MTHARFRRRDWLRALLFVAAAGAVGVIAFGRARAPRLFLTALDAQEAAALCVREGLSLADFWQRAEAMGVGAAVVREEPLKAVARRGGLLMFSRDEIEKWRAAGLVSPSMPLKPGAVWIKDPGVLEQVLQAAARAGVAVATSTAAGYHLVHFPDALAASGSLEDAPLGTYDPEIVKSLEGRRLTKIFVPMTASPSATSFRWAERSFEERSLPVGAALPRLLQTIYSHPARLLVVRLTEPAVEANFEKLRALLGELKRRGVPVALPEQAPSAGPAPEKFQRRLMQLLLLFFAVFGPLLSARGGLTALKRARVLVLARWPVAAPVGQLLAGAAAVAAASVIVGVAARACFDSLGYLSPWRAWARAGVVAPMIIAGLTLYTIDLDEWAKALASPASYARFLQLIFFAAAALLLVEPRRALVWLHHPALLSRLQAASALPWWWSWRWREILIGWPCFLQALFLINWRMDCPDCSSLEEQPLHDPRVWFMLGLFAPIGIVAALGQELAPAELALAQTGWAALAGLILGAVLIALRLRGLHGSNGPHGHGTIDLES